jgi:hypothetical protein
VRLLFSISTSPGHCTFVDYEGLNDRITTITTDRLPSFRDNVVQRDGPACVVTEEQGVGEAAHLIPHSKGDEVRFVVNSYNHLMTLFSSTLRK